MARKTDGSNNPHPRKWARVAYRILATGRYAAYWLPELYRLYDAYIDSEGQTAADEWMVRELLESVSPSIALRLYRVVRFLHFVWRFYRKLAGH